MMNRHESMKTNLYFQEMPCLRKVSATKRPNHRVSESETYEDTQPLKDMCIHLHIIPTLPLMPSPRTWAVCWMSETAFPEGKCA
jgi:hypothetical protein